MKDRESLKWIYINCRHKIPAIAFLSFANVLIALLGTGLSLLSKYAIDAAQHAAEAGCNAEFSNYRKMIIVMGIAILTTIFVRLFMRVGAQSMAVKIQAGLEMQMRSNLFKSILCKKYDKINKYHSGELMNRITSDVKIVTDGITSIIPDTLYFIFQFLGAFIVLIIYDWKFTIIFFAAGIMMSVVTAILRKKLKNLHREVQETDGSVRAFFQEAIESILVVKTFGIEDRFQQKGDILQEKNYDRKMKRRAVSIFANAGFGLIFNIGYLAALVWCALKVCMKAMTFGTLTLMLQLIGQIQTPFVNITKVIPQYYGVIASVERIMEIESIEDEDTENEMPYTDKFYNNFSKIELSDIKFSYGRNTVINGGNAVFEKGDFVAIRGISGIGKSTLMKMLLGVITPNNGKIRIYDKAGNTIEAGSNTRRIFSYVPQGNYLFSGTLRENLMIVNPDANDEDIKNAIMVSDIDGFVKSLPDGLETVIGEKGLGLSEGQAQRIAIARAIISNAPILLLDEATSALDAETEKRVLENIRKMKDRTCVIITHKKAALEVCNREIIISHNEISCVEI